MSVIDFNPQSPKQIRQEIEMKRKEKQEFKYKGSIRLRKGLTLWEYDIIANTLKEVETVREVAITIQKKAKKTARATYNPTAIYHQAHNLRSAIRKYNKIFDVINFRLRLVQSKKMRVIEYKLLKL